MTTSGRKELSVEKCVAGSRTYFFDVKESAEGKKYLVISESRPVAENPHEHTRVMVFEEHIHAFRAALETALQHFQPPEKPKSYRVEQIRQQHQKAYVKWTEDDDTRLRAEFTKGKTTPELVSSFQRNKGAIRSRLAKLGLLP